MKASMRRREIRIMQLIGATAWYIRSPFLVEGIFYGLIGAFLAWIFVYSLLLYATPALTEFLSGIPLLPIPLIFLLLLLGGLTFVGVLIGGLGALLAVKRHLR